MPRPFCGGVPPLVVADHLGHVRHGRRAAAMQEHAPAGIRVTSFGTIQGFFGALKHRPHVRLVKVADQGLVAAAQRGGAFVMRPMVRVVATAFDHEANEILRWDDTWDVGSNTIPTGARHNDPTGVRTRDKTFLECEKRSWRAVKEHEWTPDDIVDPSPAVTPGMGDEPSSLRDPAVA